MVYRCRHQTLILLRFQEMTDGEQAASRLSAASQRDTNILLFVSPETLALVHAMIVSGGFSPSTVWYEVCLWHEET